MNTILSVMDYSISRWSRHTCLLIDIITNILSIINSFLGTWAPDREIANLLPCS